MRRFLFIVLLATSAIRAQTGRDIVAQMLPSDALLPNAQALGLTADQQARLCEGLQPLQGEVIPLQNQLRDMTSAFVALLSQEKPDEAAVLARFSEMEAAEAKIKVLRLKMTLVAKVVLSADQQQRAMSLRGTAQPAVAGSGDTIRLKLQRVRDGIERMKSEGRNVTQVRELWAEFQKRAELRHHQLAMQALNQALAIVETEVKP
jgi:Spy/CpxP family protein refolding chaperone